jgi:hypothetical protein
MSFLEVRRSHVDSSDGDQGERKGKPVYGVDDIIRLVASHSPKRSYGLW